MLSCGPVNLHDTDHAKRKPFTFLTSIFRRKKDTSNEEGNDGGGFDEPAMDRGNNGNYRGLHGFDDDLSNFRRVSSSLSVQGMEGYVDIMVRPCSHLGSSLTLTPGRTRNLDRDMEALRLSRQDNPFLQVLASRESLVDCQDDNESDAAVLMSHDQSEDQSDDPLTLPEIHEHMIRSPPPTTWPRSPNSRVFRFPSPTTGLPHPPFSDDCDSSRESLVLSHAKSPSKESFLIGRSKSPVRCHSSPKRSKSVLDGVALDASNLPGEWSPELSGAMAGSMSGARSRLSLTPKAPRRCSSDTRGGSSPFSLLNAPKRSHRDEEELLVSVDKPCDPEVGPELSLLLPSRTS